MAGQSQILELRADPCELRLMRAFVTRWARRFGLPTEDVFRANLVATEAVSNAIRHGQAEGERAERPIRVECRLRDDEMLIEVHDRGTFRERTPDPSEVGGRGLHLIHSLARRVEVEPHARGTRIGMCLPTHAAAA